MKTKKTKTKSSTKTRQIKPRLKVPKVYVGIENKVPDDFPLKHYSYSTFIQFSTNPIMFKINRINGERIDTLKNVSGVVGQSFHSAMEAYYKAIADKESDPVKAGLEAGMKYLTEYEDAFIEYSTTVENKQKAAGNLAAVLSSYINDKQKSNDTLVACEDHIEENIDVEWRGHRVTLPIKLKGYIDKVVRDDKGRLKIIDYKTTRAFSNPDKIDGAKIIQAVQYYFLVYAKYGEAPYSMVYEEVKITKNRDGSSQIREYEIVYDKNEQFFDFYFRMYEDMTRAINGEAVFVPNVYSMFDNEVAITAYIWRLDVSEETAKLMKALKVDNITDLLKKKIQSANNIRQFMKNVEKKFITSENIKYEDMTIDERIRMKLATHGLILQHEKVISGHTVDLYCYSPTIGLKMTKLLGYVADVEQVVGTTGVRILAPIPNTTLVGFEIPKAERTFPATRPKNKGFELSVGVDVMGEDYKFDIRKAPHMLVAGATGSGKSVFLNSVISQLSTVKDVELHLFDPKIVELAHFEDLPCTKEYLTEPLEIYESLQKLVDEMNDRYKTLRGARVRNIEEYKGKMPYKVIVFDEFGDITVSDHEITKTTKTGEYYEKGPKKGQEKVTNETINISKEISRYVLLLAQKARAAGIHIIIATQRPSVNIITGSIKANFPTKVAFRMAKAIDSQVLIDENGAEKLLGQGDMLFCSDAGMMRLQGYNQ